jgi:hypothetical protein
MKARIGAVIADLCKGNAGENRSGGKNYSKTLHFSIS